MKKVLFLFLILATKLNAYDFEVDGFYYDYDMERQSLTVVKGDVEYTGDIVIPSSATFNGRTLPVSYIDGKAFNNCLGVTSVRIPGSVLVVTGFKGCKNLKKVYIEDGIKYIDGQTYTNCLISVMAFTDCENLVDIHLPDSLSSISNAAFSGCKNLERIIIPSSVKRLRDFTFLNCINLKFVYLPENLEKMEHSVFCNCI